MNRREFNKTLLASAIASVFPIALQKHEPIKPLEPDLTIDSTSTIWPVHDGFKKGQIVRFLGMQGDNGFYEVVEVSDRNASLVPHSPKTEHKTNTFLS